MATSTLGSGTLVLAGTTSGTTTVTATAVAGTTTLTLPAATDTLVGKATTDTLTNKTLTSPTLTGVVTFDAGTAALPAITTTGDTNTGIFFPAADTIAFTEGGAEAARFNSSGYLGIGTSSPSSLLHVRGDGNAIQQIRIANSQTSYNTDLALFTHASGNFSIGLTNSAVPLTNQTITFLVNNSSSGQITAMTLTSAGNVGIGTSSPSASAILDAQSTTKGVRMPNMTTTQKNAISSPAAGLMVFDTTLSKLCVYSGAAWQTITSV
jgi:hypothetical protein